MSSHTDMSALHNTLKSMEKKLDHHAKRLGWVLMLAGMGIVVSILTFALK